jgi:surface polysaccharide O-acyltransferase-like enzyme
MSREATASGGDRNEYVDLLRGASIVAVVVGHWLLTGIQYRAGEFTGVDAIGYVSWGSWATLVLQVVPVFFLVGGFANALSWSRRSAAGSTWADWLRLRMRRLLGPTSAYLAVATLCVVVAQAAGVSANNLYQAGWALAFQLWFLAAYAALLVATPVLYAAHRRWGAAVPVVMSVVAVLISAVVIQWRWHLIGWANYVLVWGVFHQVGFAWHDGRFAGRRARAAALFVGAVLALAALIGWAGFPVSMVGVPGARIQNASPPSMALLMFGLAQCGVVLVAEPFAARWLARHPTGRTLARRGAGLSMPIYLWHMAPVVLVGVIGYPLGWLAQPPLGSKRWWVEHLIWIGVLIVVLAGVLAILTASRSVWRRVTTRARASLRVEPVTAATRLDGALIVAGIVVICAALGRLAVGGLAPDGRLDVPGLIAFVVGAVLVGVPWPLRARLKAARVRLAGAGGIR